MNVIASKHIVNSSKDVSNGGIIGTILQLIKYSKVGAEINVNKIVIPPTLIEKAYKLETYVQMYLTTSYILTAPENTTQEVIKIFRDHDMSAVVIGRIIYESELKQEAIKWAKFKISKGVIPDSDWLDFFNIEEEDLK